MSALRGRARRAAAVCARREFGRCRSVLQVAELLKVGPALARRLLIEAGVRTTDQACIRPHDEQLAAALAARHQQGETVAELTWATGIDRREVRRLLAAAGVAAPGRARPPDDAAAVAAGYRAGASIRELAAWHGSSYSAVRTVLVRAGVTLRPRNG